MFGNPSYPTYQAFLGLGIAAAIALLLMPWWIRLLKVEGIGQQVRADGPKRHLIKQGTPTMGGVIILVAISLTCLLMGKLTTELVLVLLATLATGVLGLIDDLTSVTHGRSLGLTPHAKMIGLTIICVSVVGVVLARDPDSSVFGIVSFAWAGFGGAYGAVMLCALFWKRCNWQGALAGMLSGGLMVFVWKYLVSPLGGVFGIYELLPAFLTSLLVCVVVSLVTPAPSVEIEAEFEAAK